MTDAASATAAAKKSSSSPTDAFGFDQLARALEPERDDGNREYKRRLVDVAPERFEELVTQLHWRCLAEGAGEALYDLGVDDDGTVFGLSECEMEESVATLKRMAEAIECDVSVVCERRTKTGKRIATFLVRRRPCSS